MKRESRAFPIEWKKVEKHTADEDLGRTNTSEMISGTHEQVRRAVQLTQIKSPNDTQNHHKFHTLPRPFHADAKADGVAYC
jgi:hypothetical protein